MILSLWCSLLPSKLLAIQDYAQNLGEQLWMVGRRRWVLYLTNVWLAAVWSKKGRFDVGVYHHFLQQVVALIWGCGYESRVSGARDETVAAHITRHSKRKAYRRLSFLLIKCLFVAICRKIFKLWFLRYKRKVIHRHLCRALAKKVRSLFKIVVYIYSYHSLKPTPLEPALSVCLREVSACCLCSLRDFNHATLLVGAEQRGIFRKRRRSREGTCSQSSHGSAAKKTTALAR